MIIEKFKCYQMLHGIGVMLWSKCLFFLEFLGRKDTECSCANLLSMPLFNQSCGSHSWKTSFNNILPVFYHLQSKLKSHTWKTSFNNILLLFYRLMHTLSSKGHTWKISLPNISPLFYRWSLEDMAELTPVIKKGKLTFFLFNFVIFMHS